MLGLFRKPQPKKKTPSDNKAQTAYQKAYDEQRIKNATQKGIEDANRLANQQPFYKKVLNAASAVTKDFAEGASKTNPDALFTFDDPKPQRRRTRKKRRH